MTTAGVETLAVDELSFEVRRSARRKTVELIVDRGGELVIAAPADVAVGVLEGFVRERRFWLYTRLAAKEALRSPVRAKEFVTGEGFLYLGRSYRLLLVDAQDPPLALESGRFRLRRSAVLEGRAHFVRWYTAQAHAWLQQRVPQWDARLDVAPTGIEVRDLGFRWGSCGRQGRLYFHWAGISLPPSVLEYVVVHELVHLHEPHHTPAFWARIERALPDFAQRKAWLAEHGERHLML